jgi:hypothetical protein
MLTQQPDDQFINPALIYNSDDNNNNNKNIKSWPFLEIKMGSSRDTTDQSQNKDMIYPMKQ